MTKILMHARKTHSRRSNIPTTLGWNSTHQKRQSQRDEHNLKTKNAKWKWMDLFWNHFNVNGIFRSWIWSWGSAWVTYTHKQARRATENEKNAWSRENADESVGSSRCLNGLVSMTWGAMASDGCHGVNVSGMPSGGTSQFWSGSSLGVHSKVHTRNAPRSSSPEIQIDVSMTKSNW